MADNATRIRVAQMARVWLAPVGTTAPATPIAAMGANWFDVGYFTPDSLSWTTAPAFGEVRSHQSNYPTRRFQTEDAATLSVDLQEWSVANFQAVYGGGTVTTVAGPPVSYKFTPPAIGGRSEIAACIEVIDGSVHYRRVIPKAEQTEGVTQTFSRTAESTLPLRLSVLGSDTADAWYDLSDDPALAAS